MLLPLAVSSSDVNANFLHLQDPRPQAGSIWPPWYSMGVSRGLELALDRFLLVEAGPHAYLLTVHGSDPVAFLALDMSAEPVRTTATTALPWPLFPSTTTCGDALQGGNCEAHSEEPSLASLWHTHVAKSHLVDASLLRSLQAEITPLPARLPGVFRSNKGGWQSDTDGLRHLTPATRQRLLQALYTAVFKYIADAPPTPPRAAMGRHGWLDVRWLHKEAWPARPLMVRFVRAHR
jgi:hypothetical protein